MTETIDLAELLRMPREFAAEQAASPTPEIRDLVDDLATHGIAVHALIEECSRYRRALRRIHVGSSDSWAAELARYTLDGWTFSPAGLANRDGGS